MGQPVWKTVYETDDESVFEDTTGEYPPEMEVTQEADERDPDTGLTPVETFRFSLDRLQHCPCANDGEKGPCPHVINGAWEESWPHPMHRYIEWFSRDLASVAHSHGMSDDGTDGAAELRRMLCSEDVQERANAYRCIGGHHGFVNLDGYPRTYFRED